MDDRDNDITPSRLFRAHYDVILGFMTQFNGTWRLSSRGHWAVNRGGCHQFCQSLYMNNLAAVRILSQFLFYRKVVSVNSQN